MLTDLIVSIRACLAGWINASWAGVSLGAGTVQNTEHSGSGTIGIRGMHGYACRIETQVQQVEVYCSPLGQ